MLYLHLEDIFYVLLCSFQCRDLKMQVGLELHSGLSSMIWKSFLRMFRKHAIIIVIPYRVDGSPHPSAAVCELEHLTVSEYNENLTLSHNRSLPWPLERHDTPWYWPRSVLLHFWCSSWVTCPLPDIMPRFTEKLLKVQNFKQNICLYFSYKFANFARISNRNPTNILILHTIHNICYDTLIFYSDFYKLWTKSSFCYIRPLSTCQKCEMTSAAKI